MKQEHINEIKAIIILAVGMILLASLVSFVPQDLSWHTSEPNIPPKNLIGISGAYLAGSLLFLFGFTSFFLVLFLFFWSWNKFSSRDLKFSFPKLIGSLVLFVVVSSLFSLTGSQESALKFERGGLFGLLTADFLVNYFRSTGAYIVLLVMGALSLIVTCEFLMSPLFLKGFESASAFLGQLKKKTISKKFEPKFFTPKVNIGLPGKNKADAVEKSSDRPRPNLGKTGEGKIDTEENAATDEKKNDQRPGIRIAPRLTPEAIKAAASKTAEDDAQTDELKPVSNYQIPSLDLLEDPPAISTSRIQNDLMNGAQLLEETLSNFGVLARVADIERGPAITRYELEPAPGVKVQKFTALSDDIALAMRAPVVRIVAPIPGKNRVGIEVPNGASAAVFLKELLMSTEFRSADSKLTLSLGKDIAGQSMVADLAEMPHLLIAGTTGSGKSVCVNGIIMSILLNATPDEVKFVMVDPKMVELAQYNDIPHLICPTVTDPKKASAALNWVVGEMENRYRKLSKEGAKNIKSYNAKGQRMPYIVIIIDELADLMQVSAKTVESSITRLAQLSRAVGIHLILATQRPSVDVITGVIKANFPARISFKVASKVDSRTVLDMNGAENLLGKGDMLFIKPGDAKPTRGQCSFVKDDEINRVIEYIKNQQAPVYDDTVLTQQRTSGGGEGDEKDEFYDEAVRLVIETNQASVSILQRRMRLGYTRAARLIDMMEQDGIVGSYCGSKPRDILVDRDQWLLEHMNNEEKGKPA
jgi:S-DNA-T family DNA segregation ATPase FtsK/SpoIIIE